MLMLILLCTTTRAYRPGAVCIDLKKQFIYRNGRLLKFRHNGRHSITFGAMVYLLLRYPNAARIREMANYLQADLEDGGPLDMDNSISSRVNSLKRRVAAIGLAIRCEGTRGIRLEEIA